MKIKSHVEAFSLKKGLLRPCVRWDSLRGKQSSGYGSLLKEASLDAAWSLDQSHNYSGTPVDAKALALRLVFDRLGETNC